MPDSFFSPKMCLFCQNIIQFRTLAWKHVLFEELILFITICLFFVLQLNFIYQEYLLFSRMKIDVEQYFLHENYETSAGLLADVALLKLKDKVG